MSMNENFDILEDSWFIDFEDYEVLDGWLKEPELLDLQERIKEAIENKKAADSRS